MVFNFHFKMEIIKNFSKKVNKKKRRTNNNNKNILEQSFQCPKNKEICNHIDSNNEENNSEDSTSNDSFEKECMLTARNKWRNNKTNEINNSIEEENDNHNKKSKKNKLYEVLEIMDDFKIYKYSSVQRTNPHKLIYEYYYDKFEGEDYQKSKIILFIGKTGDGKSTAINAFFNILKGIKLEDKYRFILVKEPKKAKGQAESQTDGLHLYYVKDYNNQPIIIIDSQGFGDTRGKEYDEMIKGAFEYCFEKMIHHINTICFISKSTEARLDILVKYIFSCATSLFSQDISENLIILATHALKSTIKEGPQFIECISSDENFKNILQNMDKKWWYAVDSKSFFDNDIDKLTKYSYNQLKDLFEEKVLKSKAKDISKSSEVIMNRNKIKNIIQNIISKYKDIIDEKEKLPPIENEINDIQEKIKDMDYHISNLRTSIDNIYIPDKEFLLKRIENERNSKIRNLDNQYIENSYITLEYDGGNHTYCSSCKRNCHENCSCVGGFLNRCTIFPVFGNDCEECGHDKSCHTLQSSYKYVTKIDRIKVDNKYKIEKIKEEFWTQKHKIEDEYNRNYKEKNIQENDLDNLYNKKSELNDKINNISNDKNKINENITNMMNNLKKIIIIDLMNISQKINNIAMNQYHLDIENEYIDSLINKMMEINEKSEQIKKLKENKKYNQIFQELNKLSLEELIKNDEMFWDELKKII